MRDVKGRYKFSESQERVLVEAGMFPSRSATKSLFLASHKFTVDEYTQMVELGVLAKEDRVELVDGVILEMAPAGRPHGRRTHRVARLLGRLLPEDVEISVQSTIRLEDQTAPEPDIAILSPQASLDEENIPQPEGILLVVEVAGSSLSSDRGEKARRYAQSGIPELWIFILASEEIEVSRNPTPEGYADVQIYRSGDTLTIQELPGIQLAVDELMA